MDNDTKLRPSDLHLAMIDGEIKILVVNNDKTKAKLVNGDTDTIFDLSNKKIEEYWYLDEFQNYPESFWGYSVLDGEKVFQVAPLIIGAKEKKNNEEWINAYGFEFEDSYEGDKIMDYFYTCFGGFDVPQKQKMDKILRTICGFDFNPLKDDFVNGLRNKPMKVENIKKIENLLNNIRNRMSLQQEENLIEYNFDDSCLDF